MCGTTPITWRSVSSWRSCPADFFKILSTTASFSVPLATQNTFTLLKSGATLTLDISIPLPSISFATSPDAIISVICLMKTLLRTAILRKFWPCFEAFVLGTGGKLLSSSDLYHGVFPVFLFPIIFRITRASLSICLLKVLWKQLMFRECKKSILLFFKHVFMILATYITEAILKCVF